MWSSAPGELLSMGLVCLRVFLMLEMFSSLADADGSVVGPGDRASRSGFSHPALLPGISFEHLSADRGLVGKLVYAILQDSRGFLWVGTDKALNRYDGSGFIAYTHEPGNPRSHVDAKIQSLCEDREGTLWVGTWQGLEKFDRASGAFTLYLPNPAAPPGDWSNVIYDIHEARNGILWVGGGAVKSFDRSTGTFTFYRHDSTDPGSPLHDNVDAIFEDREGAMWFGTAAGLERFDGDKGVFTHYWVDRNPRDPDFFGFHWIQKIYEDRNGLFWLGTNGGPVAFNRTTGMFKPYEIHTEATDSSNAHSVSTILEDDAGVLWAGTWEFGFMTYDSRADSFVVHSVNAAVDAGNSICSLYKDKAGTMWMGTNGDGIYKVVHTDGRFTPFVRSAVWFKTERGLTVPAQEAPEDLQNNYLRFIYQAMYQRRPDAIVIGTATGIDVFDRRTGTFDHGDRRDWPYSITGFCSSRSAETFWTGIEGNGLNKVHERPYRRTFFSTVNAGLGGSACSLFEDRKGIIWMLVSEAGLCQFDPHTETFRNLGIGGNQSFVSARLIVEDSLDNSPQGWALWIGTNDGLWRYDARADAFTRLGHDPKDPASLPSNIVTTVFRDSHGMLWVGTDRGLASLDSSSRVESYTARNGLSDDHVLGILEDDHSRLWVSTSKAISTFDPKSKRFTNYGMKDISPDIDFGAGCCLRSSDGDLYFGGIGGFVVFHPDSMRMNTYVPPIVITGINTFDVPAMLDSTVTEKKAVTLSYRDNVFSFEFAALNFIHPQNNRYAYRLEGHDTAWTYSGDQQYARYMNIGPGRYTFRVKGSNNDGIWNEEGASIAVVITPPIWKTWWAYALYVILGTLLLYVIRRYELSRQRLKFGYEVEKMESAKLKEVDQLKSRFFANISHEFRTPLTLILGPIEKWKINAESGKSPDLQIVADGKASSTPGAGLQPISSIRDELSIDMTMAARNARRLLRLINQLLDLSKIEAGGMKLQAAPGNIVPFVRGIAQSFQSSAGKRSVALHVKAETDEIDLYFDRDKMEKILTNLLSNAFKFTGEGGSVTVSMRSSGGTNDGAPAGRVTITVSDTGIGIPPEDLPHVFDRFYQVDASQTREQEGTGIGLALTKELVELHHGRISVESEVGKGTTFTVELPMGRSHLRNDEATDNVPVMEDAARHVEGPALTSSGSDGEREGGPVVLVVEDNADVRTYIRQYLDPLYQVLEAGDGQEGLKRAVESIPDLIISDVMMPKMDGYEVCRRIKQDEKTSHIPVILLTAKAGQENKLEGLETGADDYLTKPFDAKELLVRIRNLIDLRRKLRERFSKTEILKPGEVAVTSLDDAFLQKVMAAVERKLSDETFSVEQLAEDAGMSRSQLHRKLTALTGQTPTEFIRYVRLHRAMELLRKNAGTVSETAYAVGFSGVSYFSKCFQDQFGLLPSAVTQLKID
jgi:signal transduction histidine kinase/ligand-binding sensor domain-containing protein/DNA-binding response OmpR family regulator